MESVTCRKFGLIAGLQGEPHGLCPLVDVGIGIIRALLRFGTLARQPAEIVHAAMLFQFFPHGWNAALDVNLSPFGPETIFNGYGSYRHVVQLGVR
jgi:hypothetical protein